MIAPLTVPVTDPLPTLAFYAPLKPPDHAVPSGDRRMARLLIQAWEAAGYRVELASRLATREPAGEPARQAELAGIAAAQAERLIAGYRGRQPAERPAAWFTYHVYYKAPDWIGPRVARALGLPYLIAEASLAGKRATGAHALGHQGALAAIAAADRIFAINPADREGLAESGIPPARLIDLPAFLDTARYRPAPGTRAHWRAALSSELRVDPGRPWLLAVAMMRGGDKLASYRLLGQALARLGDLAWQLVVVGDGPARAAVEAALAPLGTMSFGPMSQGRRLAYAGALSEAALAGHYAAADLCLWPAINEAYGMALLEAQAAGLPVVAGASGGVPSIVEPGETGLLAPPGDAAAFAAAVRALLQAPERRAAMAAAALDKTRRRHDIAGASRILAASLAALPAQPTLGQSTLGRLA